jgi:putative transposase
MIVEMARTEARWGYTSIRDRLRNRGYNVSRSTVAKILKEHELEPAPQRGRQRSWASFLKTPWSGIAAMDRRDSYGPIHRWNQTQLDHL